MSEAVLRTKLTGDSAELQRSFEEGIDAAKEFSDRVGDSIKETLLQVTGLVIGFTTLEEAIDKAFEGVKGVFEMSKELEHLSDRTGVAAKDLVLLQTEFKLSGNDAEAVGESINKMQEAIEKAADNAGKGNEAFARLGLTVYQLQQLDPAEQFNKIREAVASIEAPARRVQIIKDIFGKRGAELLPLFENASIVTDALSAMGDQAEILETNATTFQKVSELMTAAGIKIQGFFVGMAAPIGSVILPVLEKLDSLDLTKWGKEIGDSISAAIRILYNALNADGGIGDVLDTAFQAVITAFSNGFEDALIGAADAFGAEMLKVLGGPIEALQAAIEYTENKGDLLTEINKMQDQAKTASGGYLDALNARDRYIDRSGLRPQFDRMTDAQQSAFALNSGDKTLVDLQGRTNRALGFLNSIQQGAANLRQEQGESFQEYLNRNISTLGPTLFGQSASALEDAGGQRLVKAGQEVGNAVKNAFNQLTGKYGAPIPGQGSPNTPEASKKSQNQSDDWGLGQGKQIVGFGMGAHGWQGENVWAQGPANIETGMAGRAGRIIAGPHTVEQNTSEMNQSLKDIHTTLNGIVAPT